MTGCTRCGKEFPQDGFKCCPRCREQTRTYTDKNRNKYTRRVTLYRIMLKLTIIKALGGKCKNCGYDRNYAAFDLHHIDPRTKESLRDWRNAKILNHLDKYELLCRDCHAEKHYPQAMIGDIEELMKRIEKQRRATFPESIILSPRIYYADRRLKVFEFLKENPGVPLIIAAKELGYTSGAVYSAVYRLKRLQQLDKERRYGVANAASVQAWFALPEHADNFSPRPGA